MDPETIKSIIKSNFDESTAIYAAFEAKYGFFRQLTVILLKFCGIDKVTHIIDVGCGTGASSFVLAETAQKVTGIDLSECMIAEAKKSKKTNTEFIAGDGEKLTEYFTDQVDAILYNASIFLLPSLHKSLESAHTILKTNGICGASYFISIYAQGIDLLDAARKTGLARDGSVVKEQNIKNSYLDVFGNYVEKRVEIEMNIMQAEAFYSIPAQSASIFPRRSYEERLHLVHTLFSEIKESRNSLIMLWRLIKAIKI